MIGKLIGAGVGRRLAGRHGGTKGLLLGAAAPWLLRRAFTPLGVAALGAYGVKKLYDRRQARRNQNRFGATAPVEGGVPA